jgi:hypothetical protein
VLLACVVESVASSTGDIHTNTYQQSTSQENITSLPDVRITRERKSEILAEYEKSESL